MKEKIVDFIKVLFLSIATIIVCLGICGGLMFLVNPTKEGFLAGAALGIVFGIGLYVFIIFATIHTFINIFRR